MTVILAIIPKRDLRRADAQIDRMLRSCEPRFRLMLGPRYRNPVTVFRPASIHGGVLARWDPDGVTGSFAARSGQWLASTAPDSAARLLTGVTTQAGRMIVNADAHGSFMAVTGDKSTDRVLAWNTAPTLESVHYAEDRDYVFISNRPLVIAICLATRGLGGIRLSSDYLREYINFGFSVSGATPFARVFALPPRRTLSVGSGVVELVAAPQGRDVALESNDEPTRVGSSELVAALRSSTRRLLDASPGRRIELRLSGGIDSRLVLGLLLEAGVDDLVAVCHGDAQSQEVMVAAQLAKLAGVDFRAAAPSLIDPSGILQSMRESIRQTHGMMPSEALVSPYVVGSPDTDGAPLASGQWPLFKGVLERTAENSLDAVWRLLQSRNEHVLSTRENRLTEQAVEAWAASVPTLTNYELLYMWGRDLRSSRYLQAHAIQLARDSRVYYPYVDSEVTAVADALPPFNRLGQFMPFYALESVWPESLGVPMANGSRFRFEQSGPRDGVSGDLYQERTAPPRPFFGTVHNSAEIDRLRNDPFWTTPLTAAAAHLVNSSHWRLLSSMLDPDITGIVKAVSRLSESDAKQRAPDGKSARWLRLILWRLVLADLWLDKSWLPRV